MKRLLFLVAIVLSGLFSCSTEPREEPQDNPLTPIVLRSSAKEYARSNRDVAMNLLKAVEKTTTESFVLSPLSLSLSLGLLTEEAEDGEPLDELLRVVGFRGGSREEMREFCSEMIMRLPEIDKRTEVYLGNLLVVNSEKGRVNPSFERYAKMHYKADVKEASFDNSKAISEDVNQWAGFNTKDMIRECISPEDVMHEASFILSNVLYFNGKWQIPFEESNTTPEPFTKISGETLRVPMMKMKETLTCGIYEGYGTQVCLPYGNGAYIMNLFLPDKGRSIAELMDHISDVPRVLAGKIETSAEVDLWIPKFEQKQQRMNLQEALHILGVKKAFTRPFLSVLDDRKDCLSQVFQSAALKLDESGTRVSAVSTFEGDTFYPMSPVGKVVFHADHPFFYTIAESTTSTILFAGVFRGE